MGAHVCGGGWWALGLALSFLILLGAISSRFESRKGTGELEAGLGIGEGTTAFLKKTASYCLRGQGGGLCVHVLLCTLAGVLLGEKGGVQEVHEIYPSQRVNPLR